MPLPILFIGIAAATGTIGVGKSIHAGVNAANANKINQTAQELVDGASERLDAQRKACGASLQNLGEEKLFVLNNSVHEFLDTFTQIKNVDFRETEGYEELKKLHIDSASLKEMETLVNYAGNIAGGAVAGTAGGALVAFGAYGAAQLLATASTGTAIASLSGAAATNATLAFFGGGSLAAGGLGVAGGSAVLGGLVAGPALMVMGFIVDAGAKKNLEKAMINREEALQIEAQLDTASLQCEAIRRRTYMYYNTIARLDSSFLPLIYRMEDIVKEEGTDYREFSAESKKVIASAASIAVSLKTLLDTPILDAEGALTEKSERVLNEMRAGLYT